MGMDVAVQQNLRLQGPDHVAQALEADVRWIGVVAHPERRTVGQQNVDPASIPARSFGPRLSAGQRPRPTALLALGPLVGPAVVSDRSAEPRNAKSRSSHDAAVGIDRADRSRPRTRQSRSHPSGTAGGVPGQIRVVVAGNEHTRGIENVGEVFQIVERQIARPQNQVDAQGSDLRIPQAFDRFVGDGKNRDHADDATGPPWCWMDFVSESGIGNVIARVRAHLVAELGDENPSSASVTFLGLEALDVLRFSAGDEDLVRYVSLGCSRHPMADPGDMVADPSRGPRAELVLTLRGGAGTASGVHKKLAILAASPAVEGVVFVGDALLDLGEPLWVGAPFTAVLLGESDIADLELPEPADPVKFYEVVPITGTEAAWVRLRGADALREAWTEAGIDVRDPGRSAVNL